MRLPMTSDGFSWRNLLFQTLIIFLQVADWDKKLERNERWDRRERKAALAFSA
jgi:hypothetical protein